MCTLLTATDDVLGIVLRIVPEFIQNVKTSIRLFIQKGGKM